MTEAATVQTSEWGDRAEVPDLSDARSTQSLRARLTAVSQGQRPILGWRRIGRHTNENNKRTLCRQASAMQLNRRHRLFRLWLVGTLVILMGAGFILRPDRDAPQYLKYQHVEIDESDLQSLRLVTYIRLLRGKGLASDQIKDGLLSNGFLSSVPWVPHF